MAAPVVLLHGFTQTSDCWGPFGDGLRRRAPLITLDLPGHGDRPEVPGDLWGAAEALASAVGEPATWLGYSMGGRIALHVALARPELVERLVLIGATPGLEDPRERSRRRADDDALALRIGEIGVAAFVEEWTARPMFAGIPPERRCLEARRTNAAAGLAASLRRLGTGRQQPLWHRLGELAMPVLALTGGRDRAFTAVAARMVAAIGSGATAVAIPGAGHAAHLERPEAALAGLDG